MIIYVPQIIALFPYTKDKLFTTNKKKLKDKIKVIVLMKELDTLARVCVFVWLY